MKHLSTLIEKMRSDPIYHHNNKSWYEATEYDWDKVEKCEPFIFDDSTVLVASRISYPGALEELDSPFPVFSIERSSGAPLCLNEDQTRACMCMIVSEYKPKQYDIYSLLGTADSEARTVRVEFVKKTKATDDPTALAVVKKYLGELSKAKAGVETCRQRIKTRSGAGKRIITIRRIVHISHSRNFKSLNGISGKKIDWSHRFEVRGHWRKINTTGKDRAGTYCVDGFTWVVNHERGPDHLPIVKKVRIVEADGRH